jgi:RNA polymerase sigma-70 factor, ECF subfamily
MNKTETFEQHRKHLFGIAYRMLGSVPEAEDVVQETFVRWHQHPVTPDNPRSYLSTITTRLSLDQLRSARVKREQYIGPWLPEPLSEDPAPEDLTAMDDSLSLALLVILEKLSPIERAVFLLREVFGYEYAELAATVGKSEDNCRQILRRAKQAVQTERNRFQASRAEQERLTREFLAACRMGDMAGLSRLLSDEVTMYSDGGGKVVAATRPVRGADRVLRFFEGTLKKGAGGSTAEVGWVNGEVAVVLRNPDGVVWLETDEHGRILNIRIVRNPDKLGFLRRKDNG